MAAINEANRIKVLEADEKIFKRFYPSECDIDYRVYSRVFAGRMTKGRWKILDSYCRKYSYTSHCHHEYDCCGCLHSQSLTFSYTRYQVVVTLIHHFNY